MCLSAGKTNTTSRTTQEPSILLRSALPIIGSCLGHFHSPAQLQKPLSVWRRQQMHLACCLFFNHDENQIILSKRNQGGKRSLPTQDNWPYFYKNEHDNPVDYLNLDFALSAFCSLDASPSSFPLASAECRNALTPEGGTSLRTCPCQVNDPPAPGARTVHLLSHPIHHLLWAGPADCSPRGFRATAF